MSLTLKEQAWQSGLVLFDETAAWNENNWPPLPGGWRRDHTTVVLDHPDTDNDKDNKRQQIVVVLGGYGQGELDSIFVLNLSDPNKQWREGPPMSKKRDELAAVVCNGGIYVVGGYSEGSCLSCMERIDANDLLQSSLTNSNTNESHWTTLNCRLSTRRRACRAVAVHNQYIVVVGGYNDRYLSSVDIIDTTRNHTVTAGPSVTVPRRWCSSAVVGQRIFVVGGHNEDDYLDSVEYLDYATPCDNDEIKRETGSTFISFSSTWMTHSDLMLSNARSSCAMVAVGSCLVVAGGRGNSTVDVLDTYRNHMWNLPLLENYRDGCSLVTVANQVAVIGGGSNPSCATLPLLDKNSWCFQRLCNQPRIEWYHCHGRSGNGDVNVTSCTISSSTLKRLRALDYRDF